MLFSIQRSLHDRIDRALRVIKTYPDATPRIMTTKKGPNVDQLEYIFRILDKEFEERQQVEPGFGTPVAQIKTLKSGMRCVELRITTK